jgi:DNA-binding Lrp family transcriptional regulator
MSIHVMNEVMRTRIGNSNQKFVLLMMADAANDDGAGIWKSLNTLAETCELSRRTIIRCIQELEDSGLIERNGFRTVRGGKIPIYDIRLDALRHLRSPSDTESPSDTQSGEVVTHSPVSGDTESPKPSLNHPKEPSIRAREVVDEILTAIPIKKRRMAKAKSIERILPKILKETSPQELIKAVRSAYSQPDQAKDGGQYATAIYTFLNEGMWKSWLSSSPQNQSGALPQASVVPMGQKETIDELLAKRDAERARSAAMGSGQNGDAPKDVPGVQPHSQEETLEMFERDPRGLENARLLSSL